MHADDGRVVSNFIVQALRCEPITIHGDGSQTRSFCYVDDLIDGFIRFMATDDNFTGPVNLGNPREFTIKQLAEMVLALTGSRSNIVYRQLPADDPKQRQPDISLAKANLNWTPSVQLEQGLNQTIAYFDKLLTSASGRLRLVTTNV
jgi:UDP-glucuronate decarboxylase